MTEGTQAFDQTLLDLANIAKAMSHPGRLRILQILAQEKTCLCGDLVDLLPFSQSTVSQHLKELKRVGLINGEISGPRTCYCLDSEALVRAQTGFTDLFTGIGCCGPVAEEGEIFEL